MDFFRQDSAHVTGLLRETEVSPEDQLTRRRWGRWVIAFYAILYLAGMATFGFHQKTAPGNAGEEHASLTVNSHPKQQVPRH